MTQVDVAIAFCREQLGKSYVFGATGPDHFDCSGLMQKACQAAGVSIPRTTEEQIFVGQHIAKADLLPGDLVFPEPTHVQMYIGGGQIIQSPHTGAFVDIRNLGGFWQARRVLSGGASGSIGATSSDGTTTVVSNPLSALSSFYDRIQTVIAYLSNVQLWERIGVWALGGLILILSIAFIKRRQIAAATGTAVHTAVKAGEVAAVA